MRKYLEMFKYEFKHLIRDKITSAMIVYPIFIIVLGAYLIPALFDTFAGGDVNMPAMLIVMVILSAFGPFITGAMLGFSLLDHKDDNTLISIRVTPLSLRGYIIFKSVYSYLLSMNATFWVLFGIKVLSKDAYSIEMPGGILLNLWDNFTVGMIIYYALAMALFTPLIALVLAAFSKNKIEGFAYMKTSGLIIFYPALMVIETMQDTKQYILGIVPIFWPIKGLFVHAELIVHSSNLPVALYYIIGVFYMLVLSMLLYKRLESRVDT